MNNLKTTTALVKHFLSEYPQTRSCDGLLYLKVLEHCSNEKDIDLRLLSVPKFLTQMNEMGLPGFETVRRTRQKVQQHHPELAACKEVQGYRSENEHDFREYARGDAV